MSNRDLYCILGISSSAAPGEIKRAYRQIAFAVHPDMGKLPNSERFREVHEAYEILSDPERRRSYDIATSIRPLALKPLRSISPLPLVADPMVERLIGEPIGRSRRYFFGTPAASEASPRRLGLEAILDTEEALYGCEVPFAVRCLGRCPNCGGTAVWLVVCPLCNGRGIVETAQELILELRPGIKDGDRFEVDLRQPGMTNLRLELRVIVTRGP
jgi:molecular chaperone DnaJ